MQRDPEYTDDDRARVLALIAYEEGCCGSCGAYGTTVELPLQRRDVTWAEHGNAVIDVRTFRCLACGAAAIINRDFNERWAKHKPAAGNASPGDGRVVHARPQT